MENSLAVSDCITKFLPIRHSRCGEPLRPQCFELKDWLGTWQNMLSSGRVTAYTAVCYSSLAYTPGCATLPHVLENLGNQPIFPSDMPHPSPSPLFTCVSSSAEMLKGWKAAECVISTDLSRHWLVSHICRKSSNNMFLLACCLQDTQTPN